MSLINQKNYPTRQSKNIINKTPICYRKSQRKETPFYASSRNASYTIEAAIVMPLFITLMVFGIFIFRILQVQSGVQQALNDTSRTMAVGIGSIANMGASDKDYEIQEEDRTLKGEIERIGLLASTIALTDYNMGKRNIPIEFVDGGWLGFSYLGTQVDGNYIDIKVNYSMTFPVGILGKYSFDVSQRSKNRKWIGYDKSEFETESSYVFITDHGEVYHMSENCTYLNPSVHSVLASEVSSKRNLGGAIYYQCERCKHKKAGDKVYITDYGTAYHNDIACTEIKHNIRKVLYEEVKDSMKACSKCGGKHERD